MTNELSLTRVGIIEDSLTLQATNLPGTLSVLVANIIKHATVQTRGLPGGGGTVEARGVPAEGIDLLHETPPSSAN